MLFTTRTTSIPSTRTPRVQVEMCELFASVFVVVLAVALGVLVLGIEVVLVVNSIKLARGVVACILASAQVTGHNTIARECEVPRDFVDATSKAGFVLAAKA